MGFFLYTWPRKTANDDAVETRAVQQRHIAPKTSPVSCGANADWPPLWLAGLARIRTRASLQRYTIFSFMFGCVCIIPPFMVLLFLLYSP